MKPNNISETITAWQHYLQSISDWQELIKNIKPKISGCGPIYELPNPIKRHNESFAIADMRNLAFSEPHYHPEIEIYFVVQGSGLIVIGGKEKMIQKGSLVVIPSNRAHFTIPENDLVLAVVSTPPFNPKHYYVLNQENKAVQFNKAQFDKLVQQGNSKNRLNNHESKTYSTSSAVK